MIKDMSNRKKQWVGWNEKMLQEKLEKKYIRGYDAEALKQKKNKLTGTGKIVTQHFQKKNKVLEYLSWNLWYWCNEKAVQLQEEYYFDEKRNWRFDFAIPALKIAVEHEGGVHNNAMGHTSSRGVKRDIEKYSRAQMLGWTVIRMHAGNYTELLSQLNHYYEIQKRTNEPPQ